MKSESENNFYPFFKLKSINNNIDPSVDILIESIDRFSFGEDTEEDKLIIKTNNGEEKIKKLPPNNYLFIKTENILYESNPKLKDLNSIINKISDIKLINEENNNKGKICGLFNKEDFDVKIDKKKNHKNNQLNDSFEKKYHNPLKNLLDDEDDNNIPQINNININNNLPIQKNENNIIPQIKEEEKINNINKNEKMEEKNIINDINNDINNNENNDNKNINENSENGLNNDINNININNINVNNSNSNMKINNYDADDDKENEQKIKEINNPDAEIPFIGDILSFNKNEKEKEKEPISPINSQEIPKLNNNNEINKENKDIDLPINRNEIENNKIINNINNFDSFDNDGYESPRLGGNFIEEEKEEKEKE